MNFQLLQSCDLTACLSAPKRAELDLNQRNIHKNIIAACVYLYFLKKREVFLNFTYIF